ncbi:MAG: hypothetical protein ABIQ18_32345 [Umezawaea sp.]
MNSRGTSWWVDVLIGVGLSAACGVLAGALTTYDLRRLRPVAGGHLSEQQFDEALVASWSSRVPADPWVRDAAIRVVAYQLAQRRGQRAPLIVLYSITVVANLVSWISGNWTGLLFAGLFVVLAALFLYEYSRLGKALVRLHAHSPI